MLRLLADENFNELILVGLLRRVPPADVLTAREAGLSGADDPAVLAWAAEHGRIVVTHDVQTMAGYAYERVNRGCSCLVYWRFPSGCRWERP